jgi:hypothetical protein
MTTSNAFLAQVPISADRRVLLTNWLANSAAWRIPEGHGSMGYSHHSHQVMGMMTNDNPLENMVPHFPHVFFRVEKGDLFCDSLDDLDDAV